MGVNDLSDAADGTEPTGPDPTCRRAARARPPPPARRGEEGLGRGRRAGLVLAGSAVLLFQGLSNATVYFCNADEVGRRGDCTRGQRFRLQGTVDQGSID